MVLETLEVCGGGFGGNGSSGCEETSVIEVPSVAVLMGVIMVLDMVAVGMAIMDLVMMEAILEVVEATMILAITTINLQILDP